MKKVVFEDELNTNSPLDSSAVTTDIVRLSDSSPQPAAERSILEAATIAECSLQHVLSLESTLSRGELSPESKRGTFLYVTAVSPKYIQSVIPSRITYLSALFKQWRGSMRVRLYVTKAIFQQTKLLMVFVPSMLPSEVRSTPVDALLGYESKVVLNPSNDEVATLDIPFIHTANWQQVEGSIGTFAVVLLERIVITQQSTSTIPWILTLCSPRGRDQIRFRYGVVPPFRGDSSLVPPTGEQPPLEGEDGETDGDSGVSVNSRIGQAYAAASSARRRRRVYAGRAINTTDLLASTPLVGGPQLLETAVAVEWSRTGSTVTLARRLARLPLSPPFSFTFDAPISQKSILPYLPTINWLLGPLPNNQSGYGGSYDWYYTSSNNSIENNAVYFGSRQDSFYFVIGLSADVVTAFDGWLVNLVYADKSTGRTELLRLRARKDGDRRLRLEYQSQSAPGAFSGFGIEIGTPLQWVDDPKNYNANPQIRGFLERQITSAKSLNLSTHFMLWVRGGRYTAEAIREWLYQPDDIYLPTPKLAQGSLVSLSPCQAPAYFSMLGPAMGVRGVFTWLFNLFSGDESSPLYTIARIADLIFEFAVPLLISFDGDAPLVQAQQVSYKFERVDLGVTALSNVGARVVDELPVPESVPLTYAEVAASAPKTKTLLSRMLGAAPGQSSAVGEGRSKSRGSRKRRGRRSRSTRSQISS